MSNLQTNYLGLTMRNPLIASSSGLTNSAEKVVRLEKEGIGAVVLKSLFEEQIEAEIGHILENQSGDYPEAQEYVRYYVKSNSLENYLQLIRECKAKTSIPIIASINCKSDGEWTSFAKEIETAGADAIELNIFKLNTDLQIKNTDFEEAHFQIVRTIASKVSIPISVKISSYFNNIPSVVERFKAEGAKGIVLFNRFYQPDIDINKQSVTSGDIFSHSSEIYNTIRWAALVSGIVKNIDISSSTGVHEYDDVIKLLLSGAKTVQLCSVLYKQGIGAVSQFLVCLEEWMVQKGYESVSDFNSLMNYKNTTNPSLFERAQFMKYYSGRDL